MRIPSIVLLAALGTAARAACWDASLAAPSRVGGTGVTDLTVSWQTLRPSECTTELDAFDHYRLELGDSSAPTAAGDGRLVARIFDRDATVFQVDGLTASSRIHVAVFACDADEDCLSSDDIDAGSLSATLASSATP